MSCDKILWHGRFLAFYAIISMAKGFGRMLSDVIDKEKGGITDDKDYGKK